MPQILKWEEKKRRESPCLITVILRRGANGSRKKTFCSSRSLHESIAGVGESFQADIEREAAICKLLKTFPVASFLLGFIIALRIFDALKIAIERLQPRLGPFSSLFIFFSSCVPLWSWRFWITRENRLFFEIYFFLLMVNNTDKSPSPLPTNTTAKKSIKL